LDQLAYTHLVRRLEHDSNFHPAAFRSKVLLVSASAYLALFGVLIAIATLLYLGLHWAQNHRSSYNMLRFGLFALIMLPVFWVVFRSFFMRLPAPEGRPIRREEAPKLFETLDKIRLKLKGPKIHQVLIDSEYNAAISQLPRFGLFGPHTNYLILGLPYLLGVTHKEMLATVAHEYGHLCGNHGKLGAWVYRQRRTFGALYEQVRDSSDDNWIQAGMARALGKFMPYYNAYTFVLSRQDEYEADRTASQIVGASANAHCLVRDALLGRWVHQDFWPKLYQQAETAMRPSFMPFSAMRMAFKASYEQWATAERLAEALAEKSNLNDTHPALSERIAATGQKAILPTCIEVSAADVLLGGTTTKTLIAEFDQDWWSKESKKWEARCKYVFRSKARLQELSAVPLAQVALLDLQEFALLIAEFDTPQAAKPVLEHLLKQTGGPYPKAAFVYGHILLDEGNGRGLEHLESAAANDRRLVEQVAQLGYDFLMKHQGEYAAHAWWKKIMPVQASD
jgi:hypothetical protein